MINVTFHFWCCRFDAGFYIFYLTFERGILRNISKIDSPTFIYNYINIFSVYNFFKLFTETKMEDYVS